MILWGTFIGVFGVCVAVLIAVRLSMPGQPDLKGTSTQKKEIRVKEITMTDFTGIDLKGNWRARIIRGDKEKIRVKGPEDLLAGLSVTRQGHSIKIHMAKQIKDKRRLGLDMTLPMLQAIKTRGVTDMVISGFKADDLIIHTNGVSSIQGEKGSVGKFSFQGKGVLNMDLEDLPTRSADLNCEGVLKINLTMSGGQLTGRLKGVGEVRYKGNITRQSIETKGSCKVTRI